MDGTPVRRHRRLRMATVAVVCTALILIAGSAASARPTRGHASPHRPGPHFCVTAAGASHRTPAVPGSPSPAAVMPAGGWSPVADINPAGDSFPRSLTDVGGTLFFSADDGTHGRELWKTDGQPGHTKLVRNIGPGAAGSDPQQLINVGGTLFFVANDGQHGRELWRSNGTSAGTKPVKDIRPGAHGSNPRSLVGLGSYVVFIAHDGTHGRELWRSDGTAAGTTLVKDVLHGPDSGAVGRLIKVRSNLVYFSGRDATSGGTWRSDGTRTGTRLVLRRYAVSDAAALSGGRTVFDAEETDAGCAPGPPLLFVTRGTPSTTSSIGDGNLYGMTKFGGLIYYIAAGDRGHPRLWKTDGTHSGTVPLLPKVPAAGNLMRAGDALFFTDNHEVLWTSDGTSAGSESLNTPAFGSFLVVGPLLYFRSSGTDVDDEELWKYDPETGVPVQVTDVNHSGSSDINGIALSGAMIFFVADDGTTGRELWQLVP